VERAKYWLEKVGLTALADWTVGALPYGAQRRLEIAARHVHRSDHPLLDEPAAGLNPTESGELNLLLLSIRAEHKIGILLIEHDMSVVMGFPTTSSCWTTAARSPMAHHAVRNDPMVIRAYLGEEETDTLRRRWRATSV